MNNLFKKYILEKTITNIHIIKSQKRDLSYIYILLIMNQDNKIRNIEDIDDIIYMKIFDCNINPDLYDIVINIMMYDSCDLIYSNLSYMINKKCLKKYSH